MSLKKVNIKSIFLTKLLIWMCVPLSFLVRLNAQTAANPVNPNGYNVFYFDNGKKSSEGNMLNGKPDGFWKNYFENGKLKITGNRKNGQLDSIWTFYNEDGKINYTINYNNGKKSGLKKYYDKSGNNILTENYISDQKAGISTSYFRNGKIKGTTNYVDGKASGMAYEFNKDSLIITITEYQYGFIKSSEQINRRDTMGRKQGTWKEFFADGKVKSSCTYIDDVLSGYCKSFDKTGNLDKIEKFNNGKQIKNAREIAKLDVLKSYYDNGNPKYEGGFVNGVHQGAHREFSEDGKSVITKMYDDGILLEEGKMDSVGKKTAEWKEYHITGEMKGVGNYVSGVKVGDWKYYHTNSKIEQEGKYDKQGRPNGPWVWYYDNGKVMCNELYVNGVREGGYVAYDEEGNIACKGIYIEGNKEGMWEYNCAEYRELGNYKAGLKDSVWIGYYNHGKNLKFKGEYVDGDETGKHVYYYPNGLVEEEGKYTGGAKDGDWKYFNEDGTLFRTTTFEDGIERKFDGVLIKPTYEESLIYPDGKKKETPTIKKDEAKTPSPAKKDAPAEKPKSKKKEAETTEEDEE